MLKYLHKISLSINVQLSIQQIFFTFYFNKLGDDYIDESSRITQYGSRIKSE